MRNKMKKTVMILLAMVLGLLLIPLSEFAIEQPDGIGGLKWGESEKDDNARGMRVQKFFDGYTYKSTKIGDKRIW
jgi:hypothetical protein